MTSFTNSLSDSELRFCLAMQMLHTCKCMYKCGATTFPHLSHNTSPLPKYLMLYNSLLRYDSASNLLLPIPHVIHNNPRRRLRRMLPSNRLHKIPLRIHQIKINTMIHQIIHPRLHSLRRTKIHSILLTNVFDLLPCPC